MPKETNLNVSPYFDDFDSSKNFYQVLFKPGYPIQSRELTTLQTILQNQTEQFGNYFFKEGQVIIPGSTSYIRDLFAVEVEPEFLGVLVSTYGQDLVGKVIKGQNTGVTASISYYLDERVERNTITFYINYLETGTAGQEVFDNNEVLLLEEGIATTSIVIDDGQGFASTINTNASTIGSAVILNEGIYYIRGNFVQVYDQTLILDPHGNTPTYKVGLEIVESIITADDDSTLSDNARGFNNFSAPGADRFKISATLVKRSVTSDEYPSFIQLFEVRDGVIVDNASNTFSSIAEELARRTYDESGDYYVKPFNIFTKETLNDLLGNGGIFNAGQLTTQNNVPTDDLATYKISPGKAYVRGFEIAKNSTSLIDFPKPRTTRTVSDQSTNYFTGSTLSLNRVYGSPKLDISSPTILSLRSERVGSDQTAQAGKEIGVARVYDFALESGSYDSALPDSNVFDISLFDIQPYTDLTINQNVSLTIPTRIIGKSSGAVGFLRYEASNSGIVTAYEIKGRFLAGERLEFDSTEETRTTTSLVEHSVSDVKSVYGIVGSASTFTADVKQTTLTEVGSVQVSTAGTVTSSSFQFSSRARVGDIVSYSDPGETLPSFGRISTVGNKTATIVAVEDVSGVCNGDLPASDITPSDFKILSTEFNASSDDALFTKLPQEYVSDVDLTGATAVIRKEFSVTITGNATGSISAGLNETFLPFDEERYVLTRSDGTNEVLTSDKFTISGGGSTLVIDGLGTDDSDSKLIATLTKTNLKAKIKNRNIIKTIIVDKSTKGSSGIGSTTLGDGLTYGNYPYGTRVQDAEISLNHPDASKLIAVIESSDETDPDLERIGLTALSGPNGTTDDMIIGEKITGRDSNAVAIYAERIDALTISVVYLNESRFEYDEFVDFARSGVNGQVNSITLGDSNITNNYTLESNYKDTIYDYSKIVRVEDASPATRRLKVIFEHGSIDDSDTGDFVTANSYVQYDYCDIPKIGNISNHDIIDIRPRVAEYTPAVNTRSPFEFYGRTFSSVGTARNILASDESIVSTISHYLGRIDKVFLDRQGKFQIIEGEPSVNPIEPANIDNAMEVATVTLPPYLCNVEDARVLLTEHKRYRMKDIAALEDRISNLEFYTTLSLLEAKTESLQIQDSSGRNRFKSGFLVDNFTSNEVQNKTHFIKNSVDTEKRELRPSHYCTSIDLLIGSSSIIGIGTTSNPNADISTIPDSDLVASGIKRTGRMLTLDYDQDIYRSQPFATRQESVTPFLVTSYEGTIELVPESDTWIDTNRLAPNIIEIDNFTSVQQQLQLEGGFDQNGLGPIRWGSWNTLWSRNSRPSRRQRVRTTRQQRSAEQTILTERVDTQSQGDSVVSTEVITTMRSRNIEFTTKGQRPLTRLYPFFAGVDMSKFTVPKLVQIQMVSGTFQIGETVVVRQNNAAKTVTMRFKTAKSNHKYGDISNPSDTFSTNPYDRNTKIAVNYSPTSSTVNIDTFSLQEQAAGDFYGFLRKNYTLQGQTSGAEATVSDVQLVTDQIGVLIGSLFIPDPNLPTNPDFETGESQFVLNSSSTNNTAPDPTGSVAETTFTSRGTLQNIQERIVSTRSAEFSTQTLTEERTLVRRWRCDPLAQTFQTGSDGALVTSCDVFFGRKDANLPAIFEIRTVSLGLPTEEVLPFSRTIINPDDISLSDDASVPTTITFESPVYLNPDTEYALVLLSNSKEYTVFISRLGEIDITTASGPESQQIVVTEQPNLGSLFKSQNGSTWTPSQYEDLKFTLRNAKFTSTAGNITFYNPELDFSNSQVAQLKSNSVIAASKEIRVGLGTTVQDTGLVLGNTIKQSSNTAFGNYVGTAGSAVGTLAITNAGVGYTPSSGSLTFNNVPLIAVSGKGRNGTANIAVTNGVAVGATINSGGTGYRVGDVVTIGDLGSSSLGRNLQLTVGELFSNNELIIDNVVGDFEVSGTKFIQYENGSGTLTTLNSGAGGNVMITSIEDNSDGLHMKIIHQNHGMHSRFNLVDIKDVTSDILPTTLDADYSNTATSDIALADATGFNLFEGQTVDATNIGYVIIDSEIISYTGTSGNNLTGVTRGIDSTKSFSYKSGDRVFKYENSGVSLRRINKEHDLDDVTISNPIGLDYYHIKIDMANNGVNRSTGVTYPKLYLTNTKSTGGSNIRASQNIPFELVHPNVQHVLLNGTNVTAAVRTVSGTSIDSSGTSFTDKGFDNVRLNEDNYLSDPRIIASKVNETNKLTNEAFPGKKSFTMTLDLTTENTLLSPIIDLDRVSCIFVSNRVNNAVTNFATDDRVSTIDGDPSAFTYVTDDVSLEFNATSLKVRFAAYINILSDVRVLYSISNSRDDDPVYYPFPGYDNIDLNGNIINDANNNGRPDASYVKTDVLESEDVPFRDYEFTIDNLPSFKYFSIKVIGNSTNQAYPPRIKEFSAIALA